MELTTERILNIASVFRTEGEPVSAVPFGGGHINGTYLVTTETGKKYTFQSINANVFKKPHEVMDNIALVLGHIKQKVKDNGGDPKRECLCPVKTINGELLYTTDDGGYFRMYSFIEGNVYDSVEKPEHFYCAAKAFGKFQNYLSDFPAEKLHETIYNFHNTVWRFENLEKAVAEDKCGRLSEVRDHVDFALARKAEAGKVLKAIEDGSVPLRVTHNDTKFNNVLLDDNGEGICVLDLDTVMPGSMLYDFGDSIRFGATHAAEDEPDLTKVDVDLELFESYTKGFLESLGDRITEGELSLLAFSAKLMTLECGIRFLTDYLEGDTYFKVHFDKQNLYRTCTQLKLVWDMEQKMDQMEAIVRKYAK
ncbi:MAG: aminoglycoside phosphotransferase family protein [Clostridia bacterium]|nr:aminoglycoside phosphotransferase family protein [Clostridia bacterium]